MNKRNRSIMLCHIFFSLFLLSHHYNHHHTSISGFILADATLGGKKPTDGGTATGGEGLVAATLIDRLSNIDGRQAAIEINEPRSEFLSNPASIHPSIREYIWNVEYDYWNQRKSSNSAAAAAVRHANIRDVAGVVEEMLRRTPECQVMKIVAAAECPAVADAAETSCFPQDQPSSDSSVYPQADSQTSQPPSILSASSSQPQSALPDETFVRGCCMSNIRRAMDNAFQLVFATRPRTAKKNRFDFEIIQAEILTSACTLTTDRDMADMGIFMDVLCTNEFDTTGHVEWTLPDITSTLWQQVLHHYQSELDKQMADNHSTGRRGVIEESDTLTPADITVENDIKKICKDIRRKFSEATKLNSQDQTTYNSEERDRDICELTTKLELLPWKLKWFIDGSSRAHLIAQRPQILDYTDVDRLDQNDLLDDYGDGMNVIQEAVDLYNNYKSYGVSSYHGGVTFRLESLVLMTADANTRDEVAGDADGGNDAPAAGREAEVAADPGFEVAGGPGLDFSWISFIWRMILAV
eukprot:GHVQ01017239.1.p1 GENE.GHVQ01017239.1~~GHVQ01017239.1.p1  ORF type:complete len:525 (-),score=99.84 GHVQ01017239.1:149-1723(-)